MHTYTHTHTCEYRVQSKQVKEIKKNILEDVMNLCNYFNLSRIRRCFSLEGITEAKTTSTKCLGKQDNKNFKRAGGEETQRKGHDANKKHFKLFALPFHLASSIKSAFISFSFSCSQQPLTGKHHRCRHCRRRATNQHGRTARTHHAHSAALHGHR